MAFKDGPDIIPPLFCLLLFFPPFFISSLSSSFPFHLLIAAPGGTVLEKSTAQPGALRKIYAVTGTAQLLGNHTKKTPAGTKDHRRPEADFFFASPSISLSALISFVSSPLPVLSTCSVQIFKPP